MATVVDTIAHLFEPPSVERPYHGDAGHLGAHALAPDAMLALMDEAGVDKVLQVTPSNMGWDNRFSLEVAAQYPERIRAVVRVDPFGPGLDRRLRAVCADERVAAVRVTLADAAVTLADGSLDPFWRAADEYGVPVECYVAGEVSRLARVALTHPGLQLMVDHIGMRHGATYPFPQWGELFVLVPFDNVTIRISGIPSYTGEQFPFPLAVGLVRELNWRFGAERLQWGSNFPPISLVCSYLDSVRLVREACNFFTPGEIDAVMGGNALRVMRLGEWSGDDIDAPVRAGSVRPQD